MAAWATRLGLTREALLHSARTAIAAVVSMLFVEVSLGIAVALLVTTVWRLPPAK
jgi:hypothetical protein